MFRTLLVAVAAAFSIFVLPASFASADAIAECTTGLLDKINIFNGKSDSTCDGPAPAPPSGRLSSGMITQNATVSPFKSEGDLRKYLDCYVVEAGRMKLVTEKYLPLIAQAAKDFDIPQTLLACLIFRESRFDIKADSGVVDRKTGKKLKNGALGLGQHLRSTMKEISQILSDRYRDIPKLQKKESILSSKPQSELKLQELKDLRYAKTRIALSLRAEQWNTYITNLKAQGLDVGRTPNVVSETTIKTPAIAIGATAFYLQSILIHFRKTLDSTLSLEQGDNDSHNYDVLLAAAGAYNMGPGAAARMLSKIDPPDPGEWIDVLKRSNRETAGHILSIQNCVSPPESRIPAWSAPIGSPNLDCDSPLSRKPELPGGANTLPAEYRTRFRSATMKPKPNPNPKPKPAAQMGSKK